MTEANRELRREVGRFPLILSRPVSTRSSSRPGVSKDAARVHALDAVRALACILVVVFHSTESFEPGATSWAILDRSPSQLLSVLRHGVASFPMELMFLTAGLVSRLVVHRRGAAAFARDRLARIGVPLVVGWLILFPIGVYLWLLGAAAHGELGRLGIPAEFQHLPLWQLWLGFFLKGQFLGAFNLLHLWFLHQLLVIYALVLGARALWHRLDRIGDNRGVATTRLDCAFTALFSRWWTAPVMALVTAPILATMASPWKGLVVSTPAYSLWPYLPTTALYGLCFVVGWLLQRHAHVLDGVGARWWPHILLGLALVLPTRALGHEHAALLRALHLGLYALMMWCFMLGTIGGFVRVSQRPSPRWRAVADASYWIYLAHWPPVVLMQIAVADVAAPWPLKVLLINAVVFATMALSYRYLVRGTFVGQQLNGRRR